MARTKKTNGKSNVDSVTGEKVKGTHATNGKILDEEGFEILGGGVGVEVQIGEVVEGIFGGVIRNMAGAKKGTSVPFYQIGARSVMGGTVLRTRIEEGNVLPGDFLRITRMPDGKSKKGQNAPKIFDVRVKRASH
jgi:hypothetical protein